MKVKKIISAICFTLLSVAILNSCDYVHDATEVSTNTTGGGTPGVVYRKVLVEDYTGHKCGNCPAAALKLLHLDTTYEDKVIPLAVHAGFFATTNAQYPTNLLSTAGTD